MPVDLPFVLCVDDDADDLEALTSVIREFDSSMVIHQLPDGEAALIYLNKLGLKTDFPGLILLDINMPRMNGKQALTLIKTDPKLKHLNVFLLSTSSAQGDHDFCAQYGVRMLTKPSDRQSLRDLIHPLINSM